MSDLVHVMWSNPRQLYADREHVVDGGGICNSE